MYAAESFLLRTSIVLGLVAAVVTILYLSPMPDQFFKSCDRPCHELDWPMICRVKLNIDSYKSSKSNCLNKTDCDDWPKDTQYGFSLANNLVHGPSIHVCENDVLIVDVVNRLPGNAISIHWRGQKQTESPFMDGVPMVTQCPINSYTTFQYRFRAASAGTHLWHAHARSELAQGIFGALVVRKAAKLDKQRKLYDFDDKSHLIVISQTQDLSTNSRKLLVNGKSSDEEFKVKRGKRYRFRVAFGGGINICPVTVSIEDHLMKIISLDGTPIHPNEVKSFTLTKGERLDFVIKASKSAGRYKIKAEGHCTSTVEAFLRYNDEGFYHREDESDVGMEMRGFTTGLCESRIGQVCLNDVQAVKKLPKVLRHDADKTIYLPFDYALLESQKDFEKIYRMGNITFTYPPSPLLTQYEDVQTDSICSTEQMPKRCKSQEICECVHVENVPLGSTVELVLISRGADPIESVFHLHGYSFYVLASRTFKRPLSLEEVKELDAKGSLFKRNYVSPIEKDTIRVPENGVVALRFVADNPGFWMLRDENSNRWTRGMDVIFHVGKREDIPDTPANFPTCGSWIGPDFFLI